MMLAVTDATRCLTRPRVSPRASRNAAMPPAAAAVRARSSVKHAGLALSSTRRATAVRATSGDATTSSEDEAKRRYVNFTGFPFPLVPFLSRRTVLREVVKGKVWTLEQEQGIGFDLGVSTNVRCTIVKMRDGRLWVHDPVAPTVECLEMIERIGGGRGVRRAGDDAVRAQGVRGAVRAQVPGRYVSFSYFHTGNWTDVVFIWC